jgi:hypothetical protein
VQNGFADVELTVRDMGRGTWTHAFAEALAATASSNAVEASDADVRPGDARDATRPLRLQTEVRFLNECV